jgi:hypothetical protein
MYEVLSVAGDFVSTVDEKTLRQIFGNRLNPILMQKSSLQRIVISDELDGTFKIRKIK